MVMVEYGHVVDEFNAIKTEIRKQRGFKTSRFIEDQEMWQPKEVVTKEVITKDYLNQYISKDYVNKV